MKARITAAMLIAAGVMLVGSPSWAFQSRQISTVTASVTTGGAKTAQFSLTIRNTGTPLTGSVGSIGWTGVDPLTTAWKLSDQLLVINSTVTDANGGIKIYTDNTVVAALPRFVDPTPAVTTNPDSSAAGLLEGNTGTTSKALPMAWSIKSSTKIVEGGTATSGIGAADPNTGPTTAVRNNKFQWLFVTDKSNWANGVDFDQDGDFIGTEGDSEPQALDAEFPTMIFANGIHFGQAPTEIEPTNDGRDAYVYLQANFTGSAAQQAYQTNQLKVEAFIE